MVTKKTLLLVASPGNSRSTSQALGNYLAGQLQERGQMVESQLLYPVFEPKERFHELLEAAASASLLLLAFPLYVDHLPAPLIRFLEELHERRRTAAPAQVSDLAAIVNCGFPETRQCQPAADIVRQFAECSSFRFLGCLMLGMGGFVSGRDLEKTGFMMRHQRQALRESASTLAEGREISAATLARFGRPLMPRWLYTTVANRNWKRMARRFKASAHLYDRPRLDEMNSSSML
jgi:hypothetical protein